MAPRPVPPDQIKGLPITIGVEEGRGGSTPKALLRSGPGLSAVPRNRVTSPNDGSTMCTLADKTVQRAVQLRGLRPCLRESAVESSFACRGFESILRDRCDESGHRSQVSRDIGLTRGARPAAGLFVLLRQ